MRKLLPHAVLSLLLVVLWLLLMNRLSVNSLVFAVLLAVVLPLATRRFWPDRPRIRNWPAAAEFAAVVLWDIVHSNIVVARIVLFVPRARLRSGWVVVPLDLRQPEAVALLAGAITMTPGTLSADLSTDGRALLVHCLDCPDPAVVRDQIKRRYEARLQRIFG
ncbi:MAG: Na+/H+ antiporter subunit E [Gemmobacter sp.]|jgi:multicomponent K+:H+ antiporter subunit E|nr:Na+/H+ antiporter subunit E [Gemmobacter sp.]